MESIKRGARASLTDEVFAGVAGPDRWPSVGDLRHGVFSRYRLSEGLDAEHDRLSELLHCRSAGAFRQASTRFLRLDLVSTADELRRHRKPVRRIHTTATVDHGAAITHRELCSSDGQTDLVSP